MEGENKAQNIHQKIEKLLTIILKNNLKKCLCIKYKIHKFISLEKNYIIY